MSAPLREALRDLADRAPVAAVDHDLFGRARRVRRRRLAGAAAGAAAVLAALGLGVAPALLPVPVGPADGERAGVPSRIVEVPSRLDGIGEGQGERFTTPGERELQVGRVSVCFVTEAGRPVLIGARDGRYHLMALPGMRGRMDIATSLYGDLQGSVALSPDGRTLAWAWNERPAPVDRPVRAGVRLADLATGAVRTVRLRGGQGVVASALTWSPDGRWLAYVANVTKSWTEHSIGGTEVHVERLDSSSLRRTVVPLRQGVSAVAVDDAGRVSTFVADRKGQAVLTWDGHRAQRRESPAGQVDDRAEMSGDLVGPAAPDGTVPMVAFSSARGVATTRGAPYLLPQSDYPEGAVVRVVGWMDAIHPVVIARRGLSADTAELDGRLLVLGPHGAREVASVEKAYPDTFSVAVDLIRPGHLSEEFPAPDWPWSTERKVLTWGGLGLAALALLGLLRFGLRRRTGQMVRPASS